ncbi:MAG: cytochrome c oxidase assembly protein [Pseudomonadota bacterium]
MADSGASPRHTARLRWTALGVSLVVAGMTAMAFAAVPLYDAFCRVTGFGGETQVADAAPTTALSREMTVRFDATTSGGIPWRFKPEQLDQTLAIGESGLAYYRAENTSPKPIVGVATYNVTPAKAGIYFNKIDCFCFTEQRLEPGESMLMPVAYFIDPAIADDVNLDDVSSITLSYTFFEQAS